jgi:hypothetical protein
MRKSIIIVYLAHKKNHYSLKLKQLLEKNQLIIELRYIFMV